MNATLLTFAALPEISLLFMTCVFIIADVVVKGRLRSHLHYFAHFTLLIAMMIAVWQWMHFSGVSLAFSGHYILDYFALFSKIAIYILSLFAFIYAKDYIDARHIPSNDYYLLALFATLGMSIMVSANDLLTIYLGLELLSLPLYAMIAIHRTSNNAIESAMKYFVLGSFASGLFLYGVSFLYGVTGSLTLQTTAVALVNDHNLMTLMALVFVIGGLLFKLGAVPFHMWVPDVYAGAPTSTTLFMASAPKIASFVILTRVLMTAMPSLHVNWEMILIIASVLSMSLGNLIAIAQSNLKRMLAYSSIAHVGYTLLGVIAGPSSNDGYAAALFYIITYVIVAAGGFAIISMLSRDGVDFDDFEDFRGLNTRNPWLAFMMLLLLFSMAGIPPTVGFFAKLGLLEALLQADLIWLVVLALLFALIGAYYYLRVVMIMYFEEPREPAAHKITVSSHALAAISINGSVALFLGLFPSMLINLCRITLGT